MKRSADLRLFDAGASKEAAAVDGRRDIGATELHL
jgi:hypothetical protein